MNKGVRVYKVRPRKDKGGVDLFDTLRFGRRWYTQPGRTAEDVVYEFDASGLIAAGIDPSRLQQLPDSGRMTPGVWYFLPKGQQDPHHAHAKANPTIAIAVQRQTNELAVFRSRR